MSTGSRRASFPPLLSLAAEVAGLVRVADDTDDGAFDFPTDLDVTIDEYSDAIRSMPKHVVEEFFADPALKHYHDSKYDQAEGLTHALQDLIEIAKSYKTTFRRHRDGE